MLESGTLLAKITEQTKHALQCGALQPIPTAYEFVEQDGIRFLVQTLTNLAHKDAAKKQQEKKLTPAGKEFNPFLPYDEDLFVADISNTHVCLLNKFNVINHHFLIVTRSFEEQETCLTLQDFEAMWSCLREFESLVFYNSGKIAGASQRHKHLQMVPLPLAPEGPKIPIEPLLRSAQFEGLLGTALALPFGHAIARLDPVPTKPLEAAQVTLECYENLLRVVNLQPKDGKSNQPSGAYNLLVTQQWMMIVPRTQEGFESISINALGFAGTLLVRNEQQMQILKHHGPMTVLKQVAKSK